MKVPKRKSDTAKKSVAPTIRTSEVFDRISLETRYPRPLVEAVGDNVLRTLLAELNAGNKVRFGQNGYFKASKSDTGVLVIKYRAR